MIYLFSKLPSGKRLPFIVWLCKRLPDGNLENRHLTHHQSMIWQSWYVTPPKKNGHMDIPVNYNTWGYWYIHYIYIYIYIGYTIFSSSSSSSSYIYMDIWIYTYMYIYIYIWVNCNISLTWIVRPFGNDSSYWPWFQWGRTVRSWSNLPRYIYIYILVNYKTSQTWRGRPFGDSCPYKPFIPVTSRCEVVIKFSQISISGFNL